MYNRSDPRFNYLKYLFITLLSTPLWGLAPFRADINHLIPNYITLNVSALSFGDVSLGNQADQTVFIYNGTGDTLDVFSGLTMSAVFSATQWTTTTLLPMDSAGIGIEFTPATNLAYHDFLIIGVQDCDHALVIPLSGNGRAGADYAITFNKSGEDLKAVLPDLFPEKIDLGYNGGRAAMYGYIDNHNDSLTGVYTGFTQYWPYGSTGTFPNPINCEHTWPQSFFNSENPMKGDINHLFPTHMDANSRRSNYPFGNVTQNITWQEGGSSLGQNAYGETVFEPRDVHKGDAARAIFYFITRYGNRGNYLGAHQETDLREWYAADPVSQKEIDRNNGVYQYQHNRNPFIDHPEFLDRISSFAGTATVTAQPKITVAPNILVYSVSNADSIYLTLANSGNSPLQISGISTNASWLPTLNAAPYSMAAGTAWEIGFAFQPDQGAGNYTTSVNILSNDPDSSTITRNITFQYDPNSEIGPENLPRRFDLIKAYPNPFNARITLSVNLTARHSTVLKLYDLQGHLLQYWKLSAGQGRQRVVWNARNQTGAEVSSGIYFLVISQDARRAVRRLVLLR